MGKCLCRPIGWGLGWMGHLPLSGGCVWLTGADRGIPRGQARGLLQSPGREAGRQPTTKVGKVQHWTRTKAPGRQVARLQVDGHQVDGMGWPGQVARWPGLGGLGWGSPTACQALHAPLPTCKGRGTPGPRLPPPPRGVDCGTHAPMREGARGGSNAPDPWS